VPGDVAFFAAAGRAVAEHLELSSLRATVIHGPAVVADRVRVQFAGEHTTLTEVADGVVRPPPPNLVTWFSHRPASFDSTLGHKNDFGLLETTPPPGIGAQGLSRYPIAG
jgi:hypothetical protein